jgi:hypothetical protein
MDGHELTYGQLALLCQLDCVSYVTRHTYASHESEGRDRGRPRRRPR